LVLNTWFSVGFNFVNSNNNEPNIDILPKNLDINSLDINKINDTIKNSKGDFIKTSDDLEKLDKLNEMLYE